MMCKASTNKYFQKIIESEMQGTARERYDGSQEDILEEKLCVIISDQRIDDFFIKTIHFS